jgi:hypothetical protein
VAEVAFDGSGGSGGSELKETGSSRSIFIKLILPIFTRCRSPISNSNTRNSSSSNNNTSTIYIHGIPAPTNNELKGRSPAKHNFEAKGQENCDEDQERSPREGAASGPLSSLLSRPTSEITNKCW